MRQYMFQVRDEVAQCQTGIIFMERSEPPAIRGFKSALSDGKSAYSQFPRDYSLVCLGVMDDSTGIVDTTDAPRVIYRASDDPDFAEAANG